MPTKTPTREAKRWAARKAKRAANDTPASHEAALKCQECHGANFVPIGKSLFDGLKCSDCGHVLKPSTPQRIAQPGVRHRRDNGPAALNVKPVAHPTLDQLGSLHVHTIGVISAGPGSLVSATHEAAKLASKFGEEFEAKWFLKTKWLLKLEETHRARAHFALAWRPRFLALVALTRSVTLSARAAKIAFQTMQYHRDNDPDFEAQVEAAKSHAVELLHDVAFRRAIEGDCEPVFWQGIQVGSIIKHDGRLQLEMLRAHKPAKFKTPGSQAIIQNNDNRTIICDQATSDMLVAARQEALQHLQRALPAPASNEADLPGVKAAEATSIA